MIFVHRNIDLATQKRLRTIIDKQCRAIVKLKSTKNLQTRTFGIGTVTSLYLPCFRGTGVATILGIAGISESIQLCTVHILRIYMFDLAKSLFCCLRPPRVSQISCSGDLIFCKHTLFKCPLGLRLCVLMRCVSVNLIQYTNVQGNTQKKLKV